MQARLDALADLELQEASSCEYLIQAKTADDTARTAKSSSDSVTSFIKKQQAPPAGQDTVRILHKKHDDATPLVVRELMEQQLQGSSSIPYPVDGLIFTPYSTSYVLGMDNLLCKWQPPQRVAADMQLVANDAKSLKLSGPSEIECEVTYAPPICGITLEYLPSISEVPGGTSSQVVNRDSWLNRDSWRPVSVRWDKSQGNGDDSIRDLLRSRRAQIAHPIHVPGDTSEVIQRKVTPSLFVHPARVLPFDEIYARANAAVARGTVEKCTDADTGIEIFNYTRNSSEDVDMAPDDAEKLCRGLVLHPTTHTVLATPFVRFASDRESEEKKETLRSAFAVLGLDDSDDEDDESGTPCTSSAAQVTASLKVDGTLVMFFTVFSMRYFVLPPPA